MNVLIVEDDPHKSSQLVVELKSFGIAADISLASSLQQAMSIVEVRSFDLVLLDMAIPSHDGGAGTADVYSQPVGGLDILLYLSDEDRRDSVIVVTQYPTVEYNREHVALSKLVERLGKDDITNVKGVIRFTDDDRWKADLLKYVGASK